MSTDRRRWSGLADELDELGRAITVPSHDPNAVADRVMSTLALNEVPLESSQRVQIRARKWRPAVAAAFAVLVVLALTPPVRAAVTDWFGVIITQGEPTGSGSSTVPAANADLSLREASDLVSFDPIVPDPLVDVHGQPDGVEVSGDRRVLSLSWTTADGDIRLDQFDGELAPVYLKHAEHEEIMIAGQPAIWIGTSHFVVPLDPDGDEYSSQVREAASTLIWQVADLTLRLEGLDRASAIAVASSIAGTE